MQVAASTLGQPPHSQGNAFQLNVEMQPLLTDPACVVHRPCGKPSKLVSVAVSSSLIDAASHSVTPPLVDHAPLRRRFVAVDAVERTGRHIDMELCAVRGHVVVPVSRRLAVGTSKAAVMIVLASVIDMVPGHAR
ncbi:hypothetical protein M0208_10435 [Sphingomonas sp. SUN019]|uniref:hypothetical protein n=1 Tax=Sphingomonas sp. SUN019 TaxID=2937788 RepID=UPI0021644364|nr:hypothetical protein [Sphingomonas sp. SUN019]UVO50912.1 hypothetical protein M0208_10435 [Sphingomonas sp. SUN019]